MKQGAFQPTTPQKKNGDVADTNTRAHFAAVQRTVTPCVHVCAWNGFMGGQLGGQDLPAVEMRHRLASASAASASCTCAAARPSYPGRGTRHPAAVGHRPTSHQRYDLDGTVPPTVVLIRIVCVYE